MAIPIRLVEQISGNPVETDINLVAGDVWRDTYGFADKKTKDIIKLPEDVSPAMTIYNRDGEVILKVTFDKREDGTIAGLLSSSATTNIVDSIGIVEKNKFVSNVGTYKVALHSGVDTLTFVYGNLNVMR